MILGNLDVHHCKPVKPWLTERRDRIEVFYLPSCSPEINSDKLLLSADLKQTIGRRLPARTKDKLRAITESTWLNWQGSPSAFVPTLAISA